MLPFTFHNPTKIIFGPHTVGQIAGEIPRDAKILVTYGMASAKKFGMLDEVFSALDGFEIAEFGGIEANPDFDTLMKGVVLAREKQINFLLAVGGGSVIDGTKFMAAAIPFSGDPFSFLGNQGANICQALPIGAVLTLPASGSEMNSRSIISRRAMRMKRALMNNHLFPRFAVLDPTKTYSLPRRQIGNGVVDTFVHVLEQYLTYPAGGKVQDRLSEGLLLLLLEEGPRALIEPENYETRANLMWAATLGLNGLIGAGVPQDWAAHRAGYELTVLSGLEHAQTLSILMPVMLKVRAENKKEKLLQYARRIWGLSSGSEICQIEAVIDRTREFFERMGVPSRLRDYGIMDLDIEAVIGMLEERGLSIMGEKNDVTPDIMRKILKLCL